MKDVAVLNDNTIALDAWVEAIGERAEGFKHPRNLLYELAEGRKFNYYILDRQCSDLFDVVEDNFLDALKKAGAKGPFLLASILHRKGESVEGFHCSIGHEPMSLSEVESVCLENSMTNEVSSSAGDVQ